MRCHPRPPRPKAADDPVTRLRSTSLLRIERRPLLVFRSPGAGYPQTALRPQAWEKFVADTVHRMEARSAQHRSVRQIRPQDNLQSKDRPAAARRDKAMQIPHLAVAAPECRRPAVADLTHSGANRSGLRMKAQPVALPCAADHRSRLCGRSSADNPAADADRRP